MSIGIADDHRALAGIAAGVLAQRDARGAARALLEASDEAKPALWSEYAALGWFGIHVAEELGGSGAGFEELVVVVEQLGRAVAPGPFVPTVIASSVIDAAGNDAARALLPGLVDGSRAAGIGLSADLTLGGNTVSGTAEAVLGGGLADVLVFVAGEDVAVVDVVGDEGIEVIVPPNLDPTRRCARIALSEAPVIVLSGARSLLRDLSRLILAAEAVGAARECTEMAAGYAKVREQFGRPIGTFQAVKHHCANMLVATELATAAVWDAARAAREGDEQRAFSAAVAATLAGRAADLCANLNIQVHGGIGFTWEHDAHLFLRRATQLRALLEPDRAAEEAAALTRAGVRRNRAVALPPEAEAFRDEVRVVIARMQHQDAAGRLGTLIETGYAMPHWPTPWGRDAGAVEQLVIEEEFAAARMRRPAYGITGWIILTLIQHATADQVARWVRPALTQDVVWCQLFSEPDAGSDAAAIKTRGTRVEGGWLVSGQKVWTSGAHLASLGFATVRTNPEAPKHAGITTMVIDMHAEGVEVRPLRNITGTSDFNEVFFDDVFVPDDDVVGKIDDGWTVARATLGNESVSIGGGDIGMLPTGAALIEQFDAHAARLPGGAARIGRYIANSEAIALLNLRSAARAVVGAGPGPEGSVTKLVLSEIGHDAADIAAQLSGPNGAYTDGEGAASNRVVLFHRALSIAGGTSEVKRNQIGERILGLPRDPLIR